MAEEGGIIKNVCVAIFGLGAHMGIMFWAWAGLIGARPDETVPVPVPVPVTVAVSAVRRLRFLEESPSSIEGDCVGILSVPSIVVAIAGMVPVPVAAMMAGSAWSRSQRMVSPSDLWPNSRVS